MHVDVLVVTVSLLERLFSDGRFGGTIRLVEPIFPIVCNPCRGAVERINNRQLGDVRDKLTDEMNQNTDITQSLMLVHLTAQVGT